ncbi:MAG: peptidylprolyl isomerase [Planctomycetota bacterium]
MTTFSPDSRAILKTSYGDITLEFFPDKAPRTCESFVRLARRGFYDGLTFHRILKDFMVQAGCPKGDGTGNPGFTLRAEFNETPHVKGVLSMARGTDPHSAGSQFFICHGEARYLDNKYTAFGRVVDGLPVLDKIASVPVTENRYREASQPRDPIFINRIVLEGIEFDASDEDRPRDGQHGGQQGGQQGGEAHGEGDEHDEEGDDHDDEPGTDGGGEDAPDEGRAPQGGESAPRGGAAQGGSSQGGQQAQRGAAPSDSGEDDDAGQPDGGAPGAAPGGESGGEPGGGQRGGRPGGQRGRRRRR